MNSLSANEILDVICTQWAGTKEIMKLGHIGENRALKIKKEIQNKLLSEGYALPRYHVPMESVVEYFKINVEYLKKVSEKGKE